MFLILSLLLSGPAQWAMAAPHPQGLECIVFNEEYMTCMWGSPEKPAANYSLYYWYGHGPPMVECKRYLQKESINIGCWFHQSEIIQFQAFHVYVNTSLDGKSHVIPTVVMKLQNQVKPAAPVNLTIHNTSHYQLELHWDSPYPKKGCLESMVRYQSNKNQVWTEQGVKGQKFSYPSVDPEKLYIFQVRSKVGEFCGSTQLWSDWSHPIFWGNNATSSQAFSLLLSRISRLGGSWVRARSQPRPDRGVDTVRDHPGAHRLLIVAAAGGTADPHGEGLARPHAPDSEPQQELRGAVQHPQGQLLGVDGCLQGFCGEFQAGLQREHLSCCGSALRERLPAPWHRYGEALGGCAQCPKYPPGSYRQAPHNSYVGV